MRGEYNKWYQYPENKPEILFRHETRTIYFRTKEWRDVISDIVADIKGCYEMVEREYSYHKENGDWKFEFRDAILNDISDNDVHAWIILKRE